MRLISEYLDSTHALSLRLCEAFNQADLLSGRRDGVIPRTGFTANGLEFSFHGSGCRISEGKLTVDFDFTPDGGLDGFDSWRLHLFSEDNPFIVGVRSQDEVKAALDRLLHLGRIQAMERSSLFRLRTVPVED